MSQHRRLGTALRLARLHTIVLASKTYSNRAMAETVLADDPKMAPAGDAAKLLRGAGLRPTRQRLALARLLFAEGDRHVTAERLHEEAVASKVPVSLATVYNTLHQFSEVGLLRAVAVEGAKTYFDTNTSNHFHFFCEKSAKLLDIDTSAIRIEGLPDAPDGKVISRVDVLVRLVDTES